MNPGQDRDSAHFIVWGSDLVPYGPVELPTLISWVEDERVTGDTWVFLGKDQNWQKAAQIPQLQLFFHTEARVLPDVLSGRKQSLDAKPGVLRRIKILATLSDEQIERFVRFMEIEAVPQWKVVVKQGERGDTMYLILDGELRVRTMAAGKETILTTLSIGDFFGDISLFDRGPRSADVVANTDATLLKISSAAFDKLAAEAPDVATPFLVAIGKTLSARIRADNRRYEHSVRMLQSI
jgi:CRP/FNR family cyclic AMP-dependent transcriptional regulator